MQENLIEYNIAEQLQFAAPLLLCPDGGLQLDTWLNKRVIDVLTAIRERHLKMSQALKCDGSTTSDVTWITVKGTHIPLDESGTALAGGKLAGRNFGGGKSSSSAY